VAPPSVTVQIKALEYRLGVQLFERRPRGVLPTREGRGHLTRSITCRMTAPHAGDALSPGDLGKINTLFTGTP
jgi:hypothetical protein